MAWETIEALTLCQMRPNGIVLNQYSFEFCTSSFYFWRVDFAFAFMFSNIRLNSYVSRLTCLSKRAAHIFYFYSFKPSALSRMLVLFLGFCGTTVSRKTCMSATITAVCYVSIYWHWHPYFLQTSEFHRFYTVDEPRLQVLSTKKLMPISALQLLSIINHA